MDASSQPGTTSEVPDKTGDNSPRALISVYDKTGATALAVALESMGWQILSTGGTSMLALMITLGMVVSIHKHKNLLR